MRILLTGGSACGKSTYAEALAMRFPQPRYYIATMRPFGEDSLRKIAAHQQMRREKGFFTIEQDTNLSSIMLPARGTALLECMCNLTANEMFDENGVARDVFGKIMQEIQSLEAQCDTLIVVSNEVGSDGCQYDENTRQYIKVLGKLNTALAARFDCVYELVSGIPIVLKGDHAFTVKNRDFGTVANSEEDSAMLLVIGGAGSGKREYVKSLGYADEDIADAVLNDKPVLDNLQDIVFADPMNVEVFDTLLQKRVVICNEVGSGVIPLDPRDREVREATGRLCSRLAQHAQKAVRLVSGIPIVIKG